MRRNVAFCFVLGILLMVSNAVAGDIENGTFSMGASSNAVFYWTDSDRYEDKQLSIEIEAGYFFYKNWEAGVALALQFGDDSYASYETYSLQPYIGYHWPLNAKSNIYGRIGGGYGFGSYDLDDGPPLDTEIITFYAEAGYEYFFSKDISLGLALRGIRSEIEYESDEAFYNDDETRDQLTTRLSFRLYF